MLTEYLCEKQTCVNSFAISVSLFHCRRWQSHPLLSLAASETKTWFLLSVVIRGLFLCLSCSYSQKTQSLKQRNTQFTAIRHFSQVSVRPCLKQHYSCFCRRNVTKLKRIQLNVSRLKTIPTSTHINLQ